MYATYEELIAAHPTGSRGDAYAVGTSAENVIYNWNNETRAWDNLGGLKGAKGDTGESATITVGTVTKGETTNVENVGTSEHAILNFTLEQGAKGEKGDSATVSVGSVEQGDYPEVINVGTPQNAILNFKLQKGEKGEQGTPTVVNGKNGVNINLYATDIDMSDKEATKVSEKISNVSTSVNTLSNKVTTLEADVVKNTSVLTLEEINAGTEAELADKVPNANALKEVNNSIENKIGLPDYNNRISVVSAYTQKGSFTATDNGILYLSYSIKDGYMEMKINDTNVGTVLISCGTTYYVVNIVTFILSKGDTITWAGNDAKALVIPNSSFFPFK